MTGRIEAKRVLLVGDHAVFRQAFAWVLDQKPDLVVVAQAGSLAEGRARVAADGADVALVLPGLPNEDWTRHVRELREADPPIPVLVLPPTSEAARQAQAKEAGAERVLTAAVCLEEIISEIRRCWH